MTQLNTTLERPSTLLPAAVGALLVTGALIVGAAVSGLDLGASAGAPGVVAPRTGPAAIKAQLQSEYLHGISGGWYVTAPAGDAGVDQNQLHSEYLRQIAADW